MTDYKPQVKKTTKYGLAHRLRHLYEGQTLVRILFNVELSKETISGRVIDVGGGRNPDYFSYMTVVSGTMIEPLDGSISGIDFEKDPLPYGAQSVDTVVLCNVLEHIYNYAFLLSEIHTALRPKGKIIGFVPFLVGYHADPHDYFRYTNEALEKMLTEAGFSGIQIRSVGKGPFAVNFNNLVLSIPRFVRPFMYLPFALFDKLFLFLRPSAQKRYPLGFIFTAHA